MCRKTVLAIAVSAFLTGCATGLSPTGVGLFTDVRGPITATSTTATKEGKACAKTTIGFFISGDASVAAAKKNGGISEVSTVDYHTKGYYPFVGETCVIVTGK